MHDLNVYREAAIEAARKRRRRPRGVARQVPGPREGPRRPGQRGRRQRPGSHPRLPAGPLPRSRLPRRGRAGRQGAARPRRAADVDRRSARRHHQLRPRLPAVLRLDRPAGRRRDGRRRRLRAVAQRDVPRGEGARARSLNDRPLQTTATDRLDQALLGDRLPAGPARRRSATLDWWRYFSYKARSLRRTGSTAINLAWLAAGRFDGYYAFDNHVWDVAGGVVLVREAGGVADQHRRLAVRPLHRRTRWPATARCTRCWWPPCAAGRASDGFGTRFAPGSGPRGAPAADGSVARGAVRARRRGEGRDVSPPVRHAHSGVTYRRTHVAPLASNSGGPRCDTWPWRPTTTARIAHDGRVDAATFAALAASATRAASWCWSPAASWTTCSRTFAALRRLRPHRRRERRPAVRPGDEGVARHRPAAAAATARAARRLGVPFSVGRSIVATVVPHEHAVLARHPRAGPGVARHLQQGVGHGPAVGRHQGDRPGAGAGGAGRPRGADRRRRRRGERPRLPARCADWPSPSPTPCRR